MITMRNVARGAARTSSSGTAIIAQCARYTSTAPGPLTPEPLSRPSTTVQQDEQLNQTPAQGQSPSSAEEAARPLEKPRKKTMAEMDEELRLKMEGVAGEGGSAGVEYENGKSEGLKRGVKANMFRVI